MNQRYRCSVCGTVSHQREELCQPQSTEEGCETSRAAEAALLAGAPGLAAVPSGPPGLPRTSRGRDQHQSVLHALEILFCPSAHQRARYTCQACGRLATDEGLVCLPHKRKR